MTKAKSNFGFLLVCLALILGVVFYDVINVFLHFSYIDEIIAVALLFFWIYKGQKKKETILFFGIALFYLAYSLLFPNNVKNAIIMDFLIQVKPFVAFYSVYNLSIGFSDAQRRSICKLCIALSLILVPVGILGFGGKGIMALLCGGGGAHARFATMCTALAMTYLYFSPNTTQSKIISLLMLALGLASLRSKIFGFFACYLLIIFWGENIFSKFRFSVKSVLYMLLMVGIALYFAWGKIEFYFIEGSSSAYIEHVYARPLLYMKAVEILKDFPLFGSGLGSYATFASAVYYSPLYRQYQMIYNHDIGRGLFICDTFFPSLAQFGFVGIFLFILFWKKRIKEGLQKMKQEQSIFTFQFVLLIVIFFAIESIADSTFTHNRGMYMLMLLAICLKQPAVK